MDTNRPKQAAQWFYSRVFQDEPIRPKPPKADHGLPPLLRAARALAVGEKMAWQSRESIFMKQAKLLANYQDDVPYSGTVVRYFPTYQSLTDAELRGYFTWRTQLRKGNLQKTSLSFAFLYIYELLNQIGVPDSLDGYQMLQQFYRTYGEIDEKIRSYLRQWMVDYVVYYNLDPALLADTPQAIFDRHIAVLEQIASQPQETVVGSVKALSSKWLDRSKFYCAFPQDFNRIMVQVLRQISAHYAARCKKTMVEQYFGTVNRYPVMLFDSAIFLDQQKSERRDYRIDDSWSFQCRGGLWSVSRRTCPATPSPKLTNLLKTIDALMRQAYEFGNPIQFKPEPKWILKIIEQSIQELLAERKAKEKAKLSIDYSRLEQIRQDAAVTQEKLTVEEEEDWVSSALPQPTAPPEPEAADPQIGLSSPLSPAEYRLLHSLLYGRDLSWAAAEGQMLSVLADSINQKLYDQFLDSVLTIEDVPQLVEDYIDDLKEMVAP